MRAALRQGLGRLVNSYHRHIALAPACVTRACPVLLCPSKSLNNRLVYGFRFQAAVGRGLRVDTRTMAAAAVCGAARCRAWPPAASCPSLLH